jgi:hypothetical protein
MKTLKASELLDQYNTPVTKGGLLKSTKIVVERVRDFNGIAPEGETMPYGNYATMVSNGRGKWLYDGRPVFWGTYVYEVAEYSKAGIFVFRHVLGKYDTQAEANMALVAALHEGDRQ